METEEISSNDLISQIVGNVIGFSQNNGNLLNKYSDKFYLNYFDRLKIDETLKKLPSHQKEMELDEFVRLFFGSIDHLPHEAIYLVMSLIHLFKKIREETNNERGVKFADFTAFLCSKISEGDPDLIVPMKEIAPDRMVPDVSKVRDIDLCPAPVLSKVETERPKITKDKNKKDKKLDEKKPIARFIYSKSLNSVITLGRLSSSISLYHSKTLSLQNKIVPTACKLMSKDVAILSVAYCEREKRIGCIINNIGMTFWEASDNFQAQKIVGMNKPDYDPKACGDKIYYLDLFQEWVTTDHDTIYFWDLKEEVVSKTMQKENTATINDICEITHLRGLLVSSTTTSEEKVLVFYQDFKKVSKLMLGNPGCHSICYNPATQLIVCLGYQNKASVYQIDIMTFDINLVSELKAHTSILTSLCNIPNSSMVITGDDIGWVKLWDLNYMRCLQGIKIAKNLLQISCTGSELFYADSRLNLLPMESQKAIKNIEEKGQQEYGVYHFFRKEQETLWVITRKDAREIRLTDGRTTNILIVCSQEEEVSAAAELFNGFVIGTSKGELTKYALNGERKWKIAAHEGEIHSIKVDFENHLICTVGGDNNLVVWAEKSILEEDNVRKKISFGQKDINLVEICPYANLLIVGSTSDSSLTIWSYDCIKLICILDFDAPIADCKIFTAREMIVVSTVDSKIHFLKYGKKDSKVYIALRSTVELQILTLPEEVEQSPSYITGISECDQSNRILGSTPKGYLYCFSPQNSMINENYKRSYQPLPTIKRPARQSYDHELLKNQFVRTRPKKLRTEEEAMELCWVRKVHKDNIIYQNLLKLQNKYICSQCTDGYFKITSIKEGEVVCSRKISYPLPIQWKIDIENNGDLKNNIHEAISVIDSILKNHSFEMTMKEQKSYNISEFMEAMIIKNYNCSKKKQLAQLMRDEYTPADIQKICPKAPSLKALEAYKRLQLIKKQNQQDVSIIFQSDVGHYETSVMEKEVIRNYLQPNYLPKLLNKGIPEGQEIKGDSLKRIDEIFMGVRRSRKEIEREKGEKQNKRGSLKQKPLNMTRLKQDSILSLKNKSLISSCSEVHDKSVKRILAEINSKLQHCKKRGNVLNFS